MDYVPGVHLSRIPRTATAAVVLGLTVAACGGGDAADESSAPLEPVATAATTAPATAADADAGAVPALLQFSAPLVGGGSLDAATLANKPTAFWFWSPT